MLTNYHTHCTFCDGKNSAEEMVLSALNLGMDAIGFSSHGYTPYDLRYCMKDTEGYIAEINRLKEKYKGQIQIYLGFEEDAFFPNDRTGFDYVIGSCHYVKIGADYYDVDGGPEFLKEALNKFSGDILKMTKSYYEPFCDYINKYKPDIVGHFDLITKFDEMGQAFFSDNKEYCLEAEKYLLSAIKSGSLFEVNTGAISRGYRTTPYPQENLLRILKRNDVGVVLSSDSHAADTLTFGFEEARALLKDIGFKYVYSLLDGQFKKDYL